jgi:hypothetical protein
MGKVIENYSQLKNKGYQETSFEWGKGFQTFNIPGYQWRLKF